jgi:hypothetical protein
VKWLQVYIKSKYNLKKFILKKALLNDFENLKKKKLCKDFVKKIEIGTRVWNPTTSKKNFVM